MDSFATRMDSFAIWMRSFPIRLISYAQHFYHTTSTKNYNISTLRRCFIGIIFICVALIISMNVSKLQNQTDSCQPLLMINSSSTHLHKSYGPPYLTYILSSQPRRLNFTVTNLNTVLPNYFNIKHKQSTSHNDSRIFVHGDRHVSSLLLTYIDIWNDFGAKPEAEFTDDDWIFLFEDDVNIVPMGIIESFYPDLYKKWNYSNPNTSIAGLIEQGLKMAKNDGILYLGTCGPEYQDNITSIRYSYDGLFQFRRGAYFCTHAIAYTKWRARRIWSDFAVYKFLHNEVGSDTIARQWQYLSKTFPISVAVNIHWPPGTGHYGLFYQDRGAHPSVIQGWAKSDMLQ